MRGKCHFLILIFILSLIINPVLVNMSPVRANPSTTVSVLFPNGTTESTSEYFPGETFAVDIYIADVTDLFGFEFILKYKTDVLTANDVIIGDFLQPDYTEYMKEINSDVGYVWYSATQSPGEAGVDGYGTLALIVFTVKALGGSCLYLSDTSKQGEDYISDTILVDSSLNYIAHEVYDGYFVNSQVHDIAITSVVPAYTRKLPPEHPDGGKPAVILGETINVNVIARNPGYFTESFTVTAYANTTPIGTPQAVANLAPGSRTILAFTWDTAGVPLGKYIISATAPLSEDIDTTDNIYDRAYNFDPLKKTYDYVTITVIDYPVARFKYSPATPVFSQTVTFNASESTPNGGKINYYRWEFGDGDTATSFVFPHTTHAYTNPGTYNVNITIRDSEGLTDTTSKPITVYSPPVADFTWTSTVVGIQVNFTSTSTDPDGFIVSWNWNFGDGTVGSGENVTHTFATAGDFTANLTVTDNDGFNNTKTVTLTVFPAVIHNVAITNVTPSATNVVRGKNITIAVVARNSGSETETFNVTVYYNTTAVGPAQTVTSLSPGGSRTLAFTWNTTNVTPGTYTIKANATIVEGEIETADNEKIDGTVTVNKIASIVSISISPASVTLGESTTISGSINPIRAGVTVTIRYWLHGEETWGTLGTVTTDDNSQYSHTWTPTTAGTYELQARWEGDANTAPDESDVKTLNVKAPPVASFTYAPSAPTVGDTVNFTSTSTDLDSSIVSWNWNFGDRTIGNGETVTHTYATAGSFTINLTVTDNDGLTDTTTRSLTIAKLSSTISILATPTSVTVGESTTISGSIIPIRAGVTVTILSRPSGGTWSTLGTVTTDDNSQYSHTWTPETAGIYEIKASWEGDENALQDESDPSTVTVNEAPTGIPLYVVAAVAAVIIIAGCSVAYYLLRKKS